MKKLLIGCLVATGLVSSVMAMDFSDCKVAVKSGASFLETQIKNGSEVSDRGINLGVEISKPVTDKIEAAVEVDASIYENFEVYNLELNGKYPVYKNIKMLAGISYNHYSLEGKDSYGAGVQAGIEAKLSDDVDAVLKYRYTDLNNGLDDAQEVSLGLKYYF